MIKPSHIGIYVIKSTASSYIYIGQSLNTRVRFSLHLTNLRNNKHHCSHLQRAWNLYGESVFSFEVVEHCSAEKLTEREQAWMDANINRLYNSAPAAGSISGYKHSPETKEKIAASKRGIPRPEYVMKALRKGYDEKIAKSVNQEAVERWKKTS